MPGLPSRPATGLVLSGVYLLVVVAVRDEERHRLLLCQAVCGPFPARQRA
jgi:hypothetical protein